MHVGHLRSTVIGDALARVLRFVGHGGVAQNHAGDWGTPFGMLAASMDGVVTHDTTGVALANVRGESACNNDLLVVVADLQTRGLAVTGDGAKVVFLDEFSSKDGEPAASIVRTQDDGDLRSTTGLAAIRCRCGSSNLPPVASSTTKMLPASCSRATA